MTEPVLLVSERENILECNTTSVTGAEVAADAAHLWAKSGKSNTR